MNVTLFSIQKKAEATKKIVTLCQKAFEKKIFLQIICPQKKSIEFLDSLLWEFPTDGFLPHATEGSWSTEPILITCQTQMEKPFTHVLWLKKEPPEVEFKCTHLYDFDDQSSPTALTESKNRYHFYKDLKCKISLLT
ncbi:MAG: DNA polymerase III subunit chi [Chlamydiia bacterium]